MVLIHHLIHVAQVVHLHLMQLAAEQD